ncbi:MAG TPA: hypothetical protein VFV81_05750 [Verrucomicrobiae bacterium]|nr:hypothetical protein [Verrucomicrobiae bacterium]
MARNPAPPPAFIPTLLEKRNDGVYALAYCPICDQVVETHDGGKGQQYALIGSIDKIQRHMKLNHPVKPVPRA